MSEHENHDEHVHFRFRKPRVVGQVNELRVIVNYRNAMVDLTWTDDAGPGADALIAILDTLPTILAHVRKEIQVSREVNEIDQDLRDLFGESE